MKKKFITLAILIPLFIIGCGTNTGDSVDSTVAPPNDSIGAFPVESVSLDKTSLVFYQDDDPITLTATVLPDNADNKSVTWTSSDTSVATVNGGKVTPIKPGSTTITVKTVDGNKTATCRVSVSYPDYVIHLKDEYLPDWEDIPMIYNDKSTAEYMLLGVPLYANDVFSIHMYGDTWYGASHLKSSIANGLVTAAGNDNNIKVLTTGIYDIYSSYNEFENGHIYIKTSDVAPPSGDVSVTDIILNRSGKYLQYRYQYDLTATIYPSYATNKNIVWSSSDESVATVSSGGRVTAKEKTGTTTITARTVDGSKTDTCLIYVNSSATPEYYLTGTIGGRSYSSGTYTYAALPLGSNEYLIPNVDLVKDDSIKVTMKNGGYLHGSGIGYPVYTYNVPENKSVNMYLTIQAKGDSNIGYLTEVNRASRDIYVKYASDTNDNNKCAWIYVQGNDITPKWIKSNSLISGSTGCRFNIPKHANRITFARADKNQTPDAYYDSLSGATRVQIFNLSDSVYEYDAS